MSEPHSFPTPSKLDLETIHACYLVFGHQDFFGSGHCLGSALPRWRNSVMSPRFTLTRDPDSILEFAQGLFKMNPPAGPFEALNPYFNLLLSEGQEPNQEWQGAMSKRGFTLKKKSTIVLFDRPVSPQLPEGFHFSSGSPFHRSLKNHFLDVMYDAFPMGERSKGELFWKEIFKGLKLSTGNTRVVIVETSRGKPAAAGLVTSTANGAFLWCGGVKQPFRGRGLARPLMGIRQLVSSADGCQKWVYSTSNPRIEKFGDRRFVDLSFSQTSNLA